MPVKLYPLRWESSGEQWWFAAPIDCAAASGHSDLVRELLHLDPTLLLPLTSLPRLRRLDSLWEDTEHEADVAKCRSAVAKDILRDCDGGGNSLIDAGYGGWLLYTAATAGDLGFVTELLDRDSQLVFGDGEYGVNEILYAAARGGGGGIFRAVLDSAAVRRGMASPVFRREMMNRAVHAAARGGDAEVMEELLGEDVLGFRDAEGATVLHSAAGNGRVQVVKKLISSFPGIIDSVDDRGNTALNMASYCGHLAAVKALISSSPSSALRTNNYGDTFLHTAIAGFRAPSFRRVERMLELMREIVGGNLVSVEEIINVRNSDGRTALHMAIVDTVQSDVVELLLSVRRVEFNLRDVNGNTPLDLLKQRPRSPLSEILIRRLVKAGAVCGGEDRTVRNAHLRMRGIGGSPGTSFRIPDAEMVLYTRLEEGCTPSSSEVVSHERAYSGEIGSALSPSSDLKISSSMTSHLEILLRWPRRRGVSPPTICPVSLREQYLRPSNKRILSLQGNSLPSPYPKKKFGAREVLPKSNLGSPLSESSWSSPASVDRKLECDSSAEPSSSIQSPNIEAVKTKRKHGSFNMRLMNNYFCFGSHGLAIENSIRAKGPRPEDRDSLVDVV